MTTAKTSFARKCVDATKVVVKCLVSTFVLGALAPTLLTTVAVTYIAYKCGVTSGKALAIVAVSTAVAVIAATAVICPILFVVLGVSAIVLSSLWTAGAWLKCRFTKSV